MTAIDVITQCDMINPNSYTQDAKRKWLDNIESEVREYAARYSSKKADLSFTDDENPELFLNEQNADIYIYYIISMIDLSNKESEMYNNSSTYFNSIYSEWQKKYRRNNMPKCTTAIST